MRRLGTTTFLVLLLTAALAMAGPAPASAACAGEGVQLGLTFSGSVGSTDVAATERSMLCLLNEYRAANGLQPLVLDARLGRAARAHAEDMVARRYFSHYTPEGLGPTERARQQGFPGGAGENIAYSSLVTPRSMFEQWRTSPGHNQNMLGASYTVVGVGFALGMPVGSRGATGVQNFGRAPVPAGGDTGLGSTGGNEACSAARSSVGTLTAAVRSARRRVNRATAQVRLHRARLAAARGRRTRARARRRLQVSQRALTRARTALRASQKALAARQAQAGQACAGR